MFTTTHYQAAKKSYRLPLISCLCFLFTCLALNSQAQTTPTIHFTNVPNVKMMRANFPTPQTWFRDLVYIGNIQDTIKLVGIQNDYDSIANEITYRIDDKEIQSRYTSNTLEITIDTKRILPLETVAWSANKNIRSFYEAYPIFIINRSDSVAKIGFGSNVKVIAEAMDTDSIWKPIERNYVYRCGTGLVSIYLTQGKMACVLFPRYSGSFKTQLRLRIDNSYSQPFTAYINHSQIIQSKGRRQIHSK